MACGGRLTIAVYTLRHVRPGEELTFDYACVTESEKEFKTAICLCGTRNCRGSFLMFAGSRAFMQVHATTEIAWFLCETSCTLQNILRPGTWRFKKKYCAMQIMTQRHAMLRRQALLLRAGCEPLTEEDKACLQVRCHFMCYSFSSMLVPVPAHPALYNLSCMAEHMSVVMTAKMCQQQEFGLRECALGGGGGQPKVPAWLEKWTALILEFVQEEQLLLPEQLLALPSNIAAYTPFTAASEAKGNMLWYLHVLLRFPAISVQVWHLAKAVQAAK